MIVLAGRGPLGSGMEETYQLTSALKFLPFGRSVALVTDARFSGVSTGACIGHVSPEALEGGPIGRLVDGDLVRVVVDRTRLEASVDLVGHGDEAVDGRGGGGGARAPGRSETTSPPTRACRPTPRSGRGCSR